MGHKKVRVTNELIQRLDRNGVAGMSRGELRALERRGYLVKKRMRGADGSVQYQYRLAPTILQGGLR